MARLAQRQGQPRRVNAVLCSGWFALRFFCSVNINQKHKMQVITTGHKYELASFEGGTTQALQFIEKVTTAEGSKELRTVNDGTTNEEVLKVLIDRMNSMQAKFPCRENAIVTTHLETGLLWLEKRTADRKARGVEGKQLA